MGKVVDQYCNGCIYLQGTRFRHFHCSYILKTDKKRPCDPGQGCTVRATKRRRRKKKVREENEN
jgi:hypothetical protein